MYNVVVYYLDKNNEEVFKKFMFENAKYCELKVAENIINIFDYKNGNSLIVPISRVLKVETFISEKHLDK